MQSQNQIRANKAAFVLLEAILTVVIVSICLTFIAQSLLTNFRTSLRFQEGVRLLLVMENRLGLLFADRAPAGELDSPQPLAAPYDQYTVNTKAQPVNDHLQKVELVLAGPSGKTPLRMDASTVIYNPQEQYANNQTP